MLSLPMIRFAVFDLDGTLVDSQRDLANAANALVAELGGEPLAEDDIAAMVGEGAAVLVRRVLVSAEIDPTTPGALTRFLELYDDRLVENTRPYDGIVEVLEALAKHMRLAVLTNKPQLATDRLMDALSLTRFFARVVGGDTSLGRKPSPAALLRLCEEAGVSPHDAVLVGDSPIDLQTARNAGTQILLAGYGFGYRFSPEDVAGIHTITTPAEISSYLSV